MAINKFGVECLICKKEYFVNKYRLTRTKFCSDKCKNKFGGVIGGKKGKGVSRNKGLKRPDLSNYNRINIKRGSDSGNWKGGICKESKRIRSLKEYKLWRKSVLDRDNYQCIWGGKEHGKKLHADHIKPFAFFPELRFAIDNGRTLCIDCHRKTDTYGNCKNITNVK